jgi:hypothetical protein
VTHVSNIVIFQWLTLAGRPGFEPRLTESESAVLPLNYLPAKTPEIPEFLDFGFAGANGFSATPEVGRFLVVRAADVNRVSTSPLQNQARTYMFRS